MKITPIDERLRNALASVSNEMSDIIEHMTENDFDKNDQKKFRMLIESARLLDEYVMCFGADGSVSQRGKKPSVWNEDTIFTDDETYVTTVKEDEGISGAEKDNNARKLLEELT